MTSSHLNRQEPDLPHDDDRYGLDLLAASIDEVAAQLPPSNLVTMPPPEEPSPVGSPLPSPDAVRTLRATRWMTMAAAVLVTLLAWPAYLGWVELPEVRKQLAESQATSGPVDLTWLSPPRQGQRGTASAPPTRLALPPEGSVVWLLELPLEVRPQLPDGALIELRNGSHPPSEEPIQAWTLSASTLAHHLTQHDGVPLLLQAADLEPGGYRLQWLDATGNPVSGIDFELVNP